MFSMVPLPYSRSVVQFNAVPNFLIFRNEHSNLADVCDYFLKNITVSYFNHPTFETHYFIFCVTFSDCHVRHPF